MWLGYEDSNLGMPESESGALPLGDTPSVQRFLVNGAGGETGTRSECGARA